MILRRNDFVFYFLIFILILLIVYLISFMKSENSDCLKNPFVFIAKKTGDYSCYCFKPMNNSEPMMFFFNKTAISG